ncbi:MAG: YppE family protein [Sporolactobacillus sp.]
MNSHLSIQKLEQLTRQLHVISQQAFEAFQNYRDAPDTAAPDFYQQVKPFADRTQEVVDQWRPLSEEWLRLEKPRYIYPIQIKDTSENLLIVCVTAFQKDTRRRRFLETIEAINYVLDTMLAELKQA